MLAPTAILRPTQPPAESSTDITPRDPDITDAAAEAHHSPRILAHADFAPSSTTRPESNAQHVFPPVRITVQKHVATSRRVPVPPHRFSPLKTAWPKIYQPLVDHLKLQVKMDLRSKAVEMRTSRHTTDSGAIQKGEDFVRAYILGFEVDDAVALLRLDDLYIETFEIKDVKTLNGEHLGRAIGRVAGKDGRTKFAIENASRTRVVLADQKIHILGGFKNIHIAREAIVSLILGSPPGKVYGNLRTVASRMKEML